MYRLETTVRLAFADTVTPVSAYLRLRDRFPCSLLLESADYRGSENSFSFLCCQPLVTFRVERGKMIEEIVGGVRRTTDIADPREVRPALERFLAAFETVGEPHSVPNGLFGYAAYEAVRYFEEIDLGQPADEARAIPDLQYSAYRFVLVFNHFKSEMHVLENRLAGRPPDDLDGGVIEHLSKHADFPEYTFGANDDETSNFSAEEYLAVIEACKRHIHRGDVFQIVPSRRFSRSFQGDDFNLYRALRSVNPSPYLFYFDYGDFKIFGSSPEAQLVVKDRAASLFPIAGTAKRSGNEQADLELAQKLSRDPKESAEHVMLVDLARNDLSRHCVGVRVEKLKEIQFYSHVIHLVSKVSGKVREGISAVALLGATFPAGTLSGAPKYKAMQLIDRFERGRRGFYGGALGLLTFDGGCNHAIIIRSFLSKNQRLYYQAGGGVVADSDAVAEREEATNKLMALRAALKRAEER